MIRSSDSVALCEVFLEAVEIPLVGRALVATVVPPLLAALGSDSAVLRNLIEPWPWEQRKAYGAAGGYVGGYAGGYSKR